MAKKTKAPKSSLHEHAAIQEAIHAVGEAQNQIASSISFAEAAAGMLRKAKAHLVAKASDLRGLHKRTRATAKANVRTPSQKRPRQVPAGRKHVAGRLQTSPRRNRKASKVGVRKRVSRKQAQYDRLPWYPQGYRIPSDY